MQYELGIFSKGSRTELVVLVMVISKSSTSMVVVWSPVTYVATCSFVVNFPVFSFELSITISNIFCEF